MKNILLYIWQLPQNVLGLLLILALRAEKKAGSSGNITICYWQFARNGWFSSFIAAAAFGVYILTPDYNLSPLNLERMLRHEYGHTIQSRAWGPLYLIAVGIPSAAGNLWSRRFHKNWSAKERQHWYYNRWPEKQADELGGVKI